MALPTPWLQCQQCVVGTSPFYVNEAGRPPFFPTRDADTAFQSLRVSSVTAQISAWLCHASASPPRFRHLAIKRRAVGTSGVDHESRENGTRSA
jgi:hypothetical protein